MWFGGRPPEKLEGSGNNGGRVLLRQGLVWMLNLTREGRSVAEALTAEHEGCQGSAGTGGGRPVRRCKKYLIGFIC